MKILHTSDWHLGRSLFGRKRYAEFEAFLDWLVEVIQNEQISVLLIAGDVFDTVAPSNTAQALYYRFLCRIAASNCRHVVVIAGNHDSPAFLNAPRELLKALDVHVVGSISDNLEDEVLVLNDEGNRPELIVCAVPYLRDRDIRVVEAGECIEDKERKLLEGIRNHYAEVFTAAWQKRDGLDCKVPVVAMGHLFTAGGRTTEGDGVRELYVGSLAHITPAIFPEELDYVALGHLHVPQQVGGSSVMRYSGSPLPMGFGEAGQSKSVVMIDFGHLVPDDQSRIDEYTPVVSLVSVPVFQLLKRIQGDLEHILSSLHNLAVKDVQAWIEVIYESSEIHGDLREQLDDAVAETQLEIVRVKNHRVSDKVLNRTLDTEVLDDLDVNDVFGRCLDVHEVPDTQRTELKQAYREALLSLSEDES